MKTLSLVLALFLPLACFAEQFDPATDTFVNYPTSLAQNYTSVAIGAAGAAVTQTIPAPAANRRNIIGGIAWSLSEAPASAVTLTISDGATVIDRWYITSGGPSGVVTFPKPIRCTAATAVTATISAPGGSVIATVNFYGVRTE